MGLNNSSTKDQLEDSYNHFFSMLTTSAQNKLTKGGKESQAEVDASRHLFDYGEKDGKIKRR